MALSVRGCAQHLPEYVCHEIELGGVREPSAEVRKIWDGGQNIAVGFQIVRPFPLSQLEHLFLKYTLFHDL